MYRLFASRCLSVGLVLCLGLAMGCGGGKKMPPLNPVSGKVTVDGQPLTVGQVTFTPDIAIPTDDAKKEGPGVGPSSGTINSDGTYKLFTGGKEGAPAGKYRVTVTPSMVPAADAKAPPPLGFNRMYSDNRNSPLKVEVPTGPYDLKLTK